MRPAAIVGAASLLTLLDLGLLLLANLYAPIFALPWLVAWMALLSACLFYGRMLPLYVAQNAGLAWLLWRSFGVQESSYGVAGNLGFLALVLAANGLIYWLGRLVAPRRKLRAVEG